MDACREYYRYRSDCRSCPFAMNAGSRSPANGGYEDVFCALDRDRSYWSRTPEKCRKVDLLSGSKAIEYAVRSARTTAVNKTWKNWADAWLSGTDRTTESARDTQNHLLARVREASPSVADVLAEAIARDEPACFDIPRDLVSGAELWALSAACESNVNVPVEGDRSELVARYVRNAIKGVRVDRILAEMYRELKEAGLR